MSEPVEEEIEEEIEEELMEEPKPYMRGSVMSPPPLEEVKKYRNLQARLRHKERIKEMKENPPSVKAPGVPFSTRVRTIPGEPTHIFAAPVDGEVYDIRIAVGAGDFQEKATLRFVRVSGTKTEAEDIEIVQNTSVTFDESIIVKVGDEFSVYAEVVVSLVVTMMFRED